MVLGKLPVPGRPTVWITVGQGPTALAVGAGGGCLDIFTLIYPFSPLSPSLWETARYRLKYCLKGPLNPKQPTNQSAFSRRAVVSYWRKYVHEVLVNRLGCLSLPRKSVVRLTDRPDMTLDVFRGRKTTTKPKASSSILLSSQRSRTSLVIQGFFLRHSFPSISLAVSVTAVL